MHEPVAVLECKTAGSHDGWGDDGSADIPIPYRCQLLWQMDVLGVDTGYVACLFLPTRQLRTYQIDLDGQAREDLAAMRVEAELFMCRLQDSDPPPVDWAPATTAALKALHPAVKDEAAIIGRKLGRQYATACRNLDLWKQRHKHAQNLLLERIRGGNRADPPRRHPRRHPAGIRPQGVPGQSHHRRPATPRQTTQGHAVNPRRRMRSDNPGTRTDAKPGHELRP